MINVLFTIAGILAGIGFGRASMREEIDTQWFALTDCRAELQAVTENNRTLSHELFYGSSTAIGKALKEAKERK